MYYQSVLQFTIITISILKLIIKNFVKDFMSTIEVQTLSLQCF